MPTFRITLEKFHATTGEYWTNIYHLNAADIAAAVPLMDAIQALEVPIHKTTVVITKGRVDDNVEDTDVFFTKVYNSPGTANTMGELVPLFVTTRVDFGSTAGGRPSRKYYRGTLDESDVSMTAFGTGHTNRMATFITGLIGTGYTDQSGNDINSGALYPAPQMRQLRRGSKKKVTP